MRISSAAIIFLLMACSKVWAKTNERELIGIWHCGPYEMRNADMTITTREQKKYRKDGGYTEVATSTVSLPGGVMTTMSMQLDGRWQLSDDVVTMTFDKATFLSSDNPNYTVAIGQQQADAQMAKKNWAKNHISIKGDRMLYQPLDAMYKEAEVLVRCINPAIGSGLQ